MYRIHFHTFNSYAKARTDRLQELAETIGKVLLPAPESTTIAQRKAAGAESIVPTDSYMVEAAGDARVINSVVS